MYLSPSLSYYVSTPEIQAQLEAYGFDTSSSRRSLSFNSHPMAVRFLEAYYRCTEYLLNAVPDVRELGAITLHEAGLPGGSEGRIRRGDFYHRCSMTHRWMGEPFSSIAQTHYFARNSRIGTNVDYSVSMVALNDLLTVRRFEDWYVACMLEHLMPVFSTYAAGYGRAVCDVRFLGIESIPRPLLEYPPFAEVVESLGGYR